MSKPRGRPKSDPELRKMHYSTRLPAWLIVWLRAQDMASSIIIQDAVVSIHGLQPPKKQETK